MIKPQSPTGMLRFYDEETNKLYYYPEEVPFIDGAPGRSCVKSDWPGCMFDCEQIECHECARNLENEEIFKRNLNKLI
jgi:hypothetical protein